MLESARKTPYAIPEDVRCNSLADEISELNQALGADLDAPKSPKRTLIEKGSQETNKAAADAMEDLAQAGFHTAAGFAG